MQKVLPRKGMLSFRKLGKLHQYTLDHLYFDREGIVAVRLEHCQRTTGLHEHISHFQIPRNDFQMSHS